MQSMIEVEFGYQGITFDERMAIRRLFINDEDSGSMMEQNSGASLPEGHLQ